MSDPSADWIRELQGRSATRDEFSQEVRPRANDLPRRAMRAAIQALRAYPEPLTPLRIGVLGSYTTELLKDYWTLHCLIHGFEPELYFGPYGQVRQELVPGSGLDRHGPDFTFLLLQWQDLAPALAEPLHALDEDQRRQLGQNLETGLHDLLQAAEQIQGSPLVLHLLPPMAPPGLGLYDAMADPSQASFYTHLKERIAAVLRQGYPLVYFDDGQNQLDVLGRQTMLDQRLWHASRFPYSAQGADLLVQGLMRFPVLQHTPRAKCLVLDCDNTLWGGIIGEDGMAGIALGPDYPGNCYAAFQRRLLDFLNRGFLLAICSKNNPEDVRRVLREHPHMVLREEYFAAISVNWEIKAENLRAIAQELNLGLESFVFVDDSPQECRMMRQLLPEVRVVKVPENPLDIPGMLDHMQELELLTFTHEDRLRPQMYVQNRQRLELAVSSADLDEYLQSLQMRMEIWLGDQPHIPRLAQMTQKTNQFNLTTRRYTEQQMQAFMDDPEWLLASFSLADIFGDNGVVGLALLSSMGTPVPEVDSFLMSCRVIGRRAEEVFLQALLDHLRRTGKQGLRAQYRPTPKNALVEDFWPSMGFRTVGEGCFELDLVSPSGEAPALSFIEVALKEERI